MASNQNSTEVTTYHKEHQDIENKLFSQVQTSASGYDIADLCDAVMYMHDQKFLIFIH